MEKEMVVNVDLIKNRRKELNLTQKELSEKTEIPLGTIKSIEAGNLNLNKENEKSLQKILKIKDSKELKKPLKKDTKLIAFSIHKGGAGKTSICANLAHTFANMGYKVLAIDTDPQKNLTHSFDLPPSEKTFYKAFVPDNIQDIRDYITPTEFKNIDFVIGDAALAFIDLRILKMYRKEDRMRSILEGVLNDGIYDFVMVDCNPTIGSFNTAILSCMDEIIVPIEPSAFGIEGLRTFSEHLNFLLRNNKSLNLTGIVLNKVAGNKAISQEASDVINAVYGEKVLKSRIRIDTNIEQAQFAKRPLWEIAPKTRAIEDFNSLAKEVLGIIQNR